MCIIGSMKTKDELLAIAQSNCPKLTLPLIRDIVEEIEMGDDLHAKIDLQLTADNWGLSVCEVYRLINPVLK